MGGTSAGTKPAPMALILMALVGGLVLAGCARNRYPLTPCEGDRPAIARTHDAAPPNCPAG
ncbi:MAG: hypothetical protein H6895_09550 [Defluviimonas sp.]|uniref:hypothetical protein n=1 Tax=Albidovulum sp. TaxID=1872424 RepID=UPI001D82C92C|nr:hypothetical protein [Paracoccaceae bacterium]MCC0064318.1 hypothetical protein [Defluviimonas sp.]